MVSHLRAEPAGEAWLGPTHWPVAWQGLLGILPRCMIWCFSRRYARPRRTCEGATGWVVSRAVALGESALDRPAGQTSVATACGASSGNVFSGGDEQEERQSEGNDTRTGGYRCLPLTILT